MRFKKNIYIYLFKRDDSVLTAIEENYLELKTSTHEKKKGFNMLLY